MGYQDIDEGRILSNLRKNPNYYDGIDFKKIEEKVEKLRQWRANAPARAMDDMDDMLNNCFNFRGVNKGGIDNE